MAIKLSTAVRDALLDAVETTVGSNAILKFFTGAAPASPASGNSGIEIAILSLPSDWLATASNGSKSKLGTWQDAAADASGTIGHFRIYASDGTTCHMQGSVTATGGNGDIKLSTVAVNAGQPININSFTLNAPHA